MKGNDFTTLEHAKAFRVDYEQRLRILVGIVEAIRYMHARDIIHLDIKPHNVLLTTNGVAKLCDFGLSQFLGTSSQISAHGFTTNYSAPEQISGSKYVNKKADIWSLGVLIYCLMTLIDPYHYYFG